MTFLVPCPNCGPREAAEFSFGGESSKRPGPGGTGEQLARYLYFKVNGSGPQREWWYHRDGCGRWFVAIRDTRTNAFSASFWPGGEATARRTEAEGEGRPPGPASEGASAT